MWRHAACVWKNAVRYPPKGGNTTDCNRTFSEAHPQNKRKNKVRMDDFTITPMSKTVHVVDDECSDMSCYVLTGVLPS